MPYGGSGQRFVEKGRSRRLYLRDGLALQAIDVTYPDDIWIDSTMPPGMGIYLFLEVSETFHLTIGGRCLPVGDHGDKGDLPLGICHWRGRPAPILRGGPRGTRLCSVAVWLEPEWFDATFGLHSGALPPGSREHLAVSRWSPSSRLIALAGSLFERESSGPALARLRYETFALEMTREALATISQPTAPQTQRVDLLHLNAARDLIEAELEKDLSIQQIARHVGIGVAALRRLFRAAHGCTIAEYIRVRRLHAARTILEEGGAVSLAAERAGYRSQANFSTAFRRHFGITPRRARSGE